MGPLYGRDGKPAGKFISQIIINERIVVELYNNPQADNNLDIWISQDSGGKDVSYVGLKLATLNKIHGIANGSTETVKVLYGKKDK